MKNSFRQALATYTLLLAFATGCNQENADLVLVNGRIWTAQGEDSFVEAVAIRGNKIIQIGSTQDMRKLAGKSTRVVDLEGKLAIPGFNDAHIHFLGGSIGLFEIDLTKAKTGADIVIAVDSFARLNPDAEWIRGRGWQYTQFPSGLPTVEDMKGLRSDRPIFLRAYDGHSGWANPMAMKLAGITNQTKPAGFGQIVLDAKGIPTGTLLEDAQLLVSKFIPSPSRETQLEALLQGLKMVSSLGITSMQNASGSVNELALYLDLQLNGELTARYSAALSVEDRTTEDEIDSFRVMRTLLSTNPLIKADAIKFMLDGVIESHTAAMLKAYDDAPDEKGDFAIPLEKYRTLVNALDKDGFRLYTHAIGDLAVREALNAYENAQQVNGQQQRRNRVEHIETISPEDIPRFAKLDVMASMEPIHADPGTMGVWKNAIGKDRLPYSFAWNSLLKENAHLVFSSDWPACIDINPIRGIHVAVNRRTPEGFPEGGWIPEQKISIAKALLAYTRAGAYASFEEEIKGQIKPGMLADIIVLSDDLFTIDPMRIASTQVILTIFDGKIIYEKGK